MLEPIAHPMPETLLIDEETGYTMNLPAEYQGYPGWWKDDPESYAKLQAARQKFEIVVLDFADPRFMPQDDPTDVED